MQVVTERAEDPKNKRHLFHLALPVKNLEITLAFYEKYFACVQGRKASTWVDVNFYGHQLSFHESKTASPLQAENIVDKKTVYLPHLGVILSMDEWYQLRNTLQENKYPFLMEPCIRFAGQAGEQATMFFSDPNGYALEFKAFADMENVFKS